jgi:hypothetical protein
MRQWLFFPGDPNCFPNANRKPRLLTLYLDSNLTECGFSWGVLSVQEVELDAHLLLLVGIITLTMTQQIDRRVAD